jgi:hypothetical protein
MSICINQVEPSFANVLAESWSACREFKTLFLDVILKLLNNTLHGFDYC